jgi:hypothetical protein
MRIFKWTCGTLLALFSIFLLLVGVIAFNSQGSTPPAARPEASPKPSLQPSPTLETVEDAPENESTSSEKPPLPVYESSLNLSVKELFFHKVPDVGWVPRFSHAADIGDPVEMENGRVIYSVLVTEENSFDHDSQDAEVEVVAARDGTRIYRVTSRFELNEHNGPYILPDDITSFYVLLTTLIGALAPDCEALAEEPYQNFTQSPFQGGDTRDIYVCGLSLGLTVTPQVVGAELTVQIIPSEK